MSSGSGGAPGLVEQVLAGSSRDLQAFAAEGVLPIDPTELVALQVVLTGSEDPEIAAAAQQSLDDTDPRLLAEIAAEADHTLLVALCGCVTHPVMLAAALRRRSVDVGLLCDLAASISEELQGILLQRQSDIRRHPEILVALERNPAVGSTAKRLIAEYRQHLLLDNVALALPQVIEEEDEGPDEEVVAAIEQAAREVPSRGEMDDQTGLSEDQIRSMSVGVKVKLAHGASTKLRSILLRDNNPMVAVAALTKSAISELEVERLCRSHNICGDVLVEVARNRSWMGRYSILLAVVKNPKTPDGMALRLVPRLAVRDLRLLVSNRGVPQAVRTMAGRIYRQKSG